MKFSFSFTLCTESTNHEMNEMCFANHKSTDIIIIIYRASDISCAMNNYDLLSLIDREDIDVIYDDLTSHTRLHPYTYFTNCNVYVHVVVYIHLHIFATRADGIRSVFEMMGEI